MNIVFKKTGKEIKSAISNRRTQLESRLNSRNKTLNEFIQNPEKVRSYLTRNTKPDYSHHGRMGYVLYGKDDISSEERQEIDQLCQRIFEIEQELHRLSFVVTHLDDNTIFDLSFEELLGYGFEAAD
ncbi:MAG: hypothetical protein J0L96_07820 [Anaerolineae bacterium]|jgi:hypothetical protein|nr:hypothetical protein [Anaerolineae bacterium]